MPDPILLAVAAALAGKGSEAAVACGRNALAAVSRMVRERFSRGGWEESALRAAIEHPDDPERQKLLARALDRLVRDDPGFAAEVRAWWAERADPAQRVTNSFSGRAHAVVQAGEVHGDVRL